MLVPQKMRRYRGLKLEVVQVEAVLNESALADWRFLVMTFVTLTYQYKEASWDSKNEKLLEEKKFSSGRIVWVCFDQC